MTALVAKDKECQKLRPLCIAYRRYNEAVDVYIF